MTHSDAFSLIGKRALIFGGTSGLGKSIAVGYAEAGADVIPVGRRPQEVKAAVAEIRATGKRALELVGDAINSWKK